ncbi:lysozyme inhibitor LprI family protein [Sphingomonas koreensis]
MLFSITLALLGQQAGSELNCTSPRNQLEMAACSYRRLQRADAQLNRQWKLALARTKKDLQFQRPELHDGKSDAQLLIEAQRTWIAFRDAQCAFEKTFMPGSGGPTMKTDCLERLTLARTQELRDLWRN